MSNFLEQAKKADEQAQEMAELAKELSEIEGVVVVHDEIIIPLDKVAEVKARMQAFNRRRVWH